MYIYNYSRNILSRKSFARAFYIYTIKNIQNIVPKKYSIYMQLKQEYIVKNIALREHSICIQQTKVYSIEYSSKKYFVYI